MQQAPRHSGLQRPIAGNSRSALCHLLVCWWFSVMQGRPRRTRIWPESRAGAGPRRRSRGGGASTSGIAWPFHNHSSAAPGIACQLQDEAMAFAERHAGVRGCGSWIARERPIRMSPMGRLCQFTRLRNSRLRCATASSQAGGSSTSHNCRWGKQGWVTSNDYLLAESVSPPAVCHRRLTLQSSHRTSLDEVQHRAGS